MSELKTLKDVCNWVDLNDPNPTTNAYLGKDIQKLARKWIKELETGCFHRKNDKIISHPLKLGGKNSECIGCSEGQECCKEYIVIWIKHFFNLEE